MVQLPQAETDMLWDDGTQNVEPVMDIYAPDHITLVRFMGSASLCALCACSMYLTVQDQYKHLLDTVYGL